MAWSAVRPKAYGRRAARADRRRSSEVEHTLGKRGVGGSIPPGGTIPNQQIIRCFSSDELDDSVGLVTVLVTELQSAGPGDTEVPGP